MHCPLIVAFDKIIDEIYKNYDFERHYYNADTGEEIFFPEEEMDPKKLNEENIFILFKETVKEIRYNTILNAFSITFI